MACDYKTIRSENRSRYGTDIDRIGSIFFANQYDDRTHFIYELLQNAEDALARRANWRGPRAVSFLLERDCLRVSHFGAPFDENDVRGICGIAKSTKPLTAIGRFGIGFKSVFAFTRRPEIHSGSEAFAIESFVRPVATRPVLREVEETVIVVPLKGDVEAARREIVDGLTRLGPTSLLFLRHITEVSWRVDGVDAGLYLRECEEESAGVRHVSVIGEQPEKADVDEEWLVFSRAVHTLDRPRAGHVEIAWLRTKDESGRKTIKVVNRSPLVVFFPTVVETRLGFLTQGPYRTTPSRDNVPPRDDWNQMCVRETGNLLVESLRWLRDQRMLDAGVLACLPLDPAVLEGSMFRGLFDDVRKALRRERLLPAAGGGYARAEDSCLGRGKELRQLVSPAQLGTLYRRNGPLLWLEQAISRNRTPELWRYLIQDLEVQECAPPAVLRLLTRVFLERQTDEWVQQLYEFLGSRPALRSLAASRPILRLEDGSHVTPAAGGEPQAFLPGAARTGFPTVRAGVCRTAKALEFLTALDLTEADRVDDVIRNVLPRYRKRAEVPDAKYAADVGLMVAAIGTDSQEAEKRLVRALRKTPWVKAMDSSGRPGLWKKPGDLYVATDSLRRLFGDVETVLFVDPRVPCLASSDAHRLLAKSEAARNLRLVSALPGRSEEELKEIRLRHGLTRATWQQLEDKTIRGLDALLDTFPALDRDERSARARHLWYVLVDLTKRRGSQAFESKYSWGYYAERQETRIPAAFVVQLNRRQWVPDISGILRRPVSIAFKDTGWERNDFLQSTLCFKRTRLERLAREAGFDPGILTILQEEGVTSAAELRKRLVRQNDREEFGGEEAGGQPSPPSAGRGPKPAGRDGSGVRSRDPASESANGTARESPSGGGSPREFVSYVAAIPDDAEARDPDGLEHAGRMDLERSAIEFIVQREPSWRRTPVNNRGFDLYRGTSIETATEFCEVKAMTGTLDDRPVGMSSAQFECARDQGNAYWLYVVERAGTGAPNLLRIRDPVRHAKTFTFDRGWRAVAE